jgi:leader peptidase (prepilin peptidase) / N-methyltransferase
MLSCHAGTNRWLAAATLVTTATCVAVGLRFGIGAQLPAFEYLAAVSVPLAFIDARQHRLPDRITLPSYPVAAVLLGLAALFVPAGAPHLLHAAVGLAVAVAFPAVLLLVSPGGLGLGDVKLSGLCGAYLGWLGLTPFLTGMLAAWLMAGLAGLALMLAGRATRRSEIPFGPFLVAGTLAVVLAGGFVPALAR